MLAIVVGGGELLASRRALAAAAAADYVVAADSGLRHLPALGRRADLVVGDYDSSTRPEPSADGPEIVVYPVAKDDTDLALAVREAVRRGADAVRLLAALRGPRLDHGAANLLLLSAAEFRGVDLRAIDGDDELRAVRDVAAIEGRRGDLVSLLPITARCLGVSTENLAYPLDRATLYRGSTRGVSNALTAAHGRVALSHGLLLLVHRDGGDPNAL